MDHFFKFIYLVFICVGLYIDVSICSGNNVNVGNTPENGIHQNREKLSPLWFGPRVGRKKREENFGERSKVSELLETINEYPWTIIAVNDNSEMQKRTNIHNFTPRMGRTLEDPSIVDDQTDVAERTVTYLSPIGRDRHFNPYSPRLGRDELGGYL